MKVKTIKASIERKGIYKGHAVTERMKSIRRGCLELGISRRKLAAFAGVSDTTIYNAVKGIYTPSLGLYIEIGQLLGWDMSRDANYIYAFRTIPSEQFYSRLSYIFPSRLGFKRDMRFKLMKYTGFSAYEVAGALGYSPRIRLSVFAGCLLAIRDLERRYHVKRVLEVED